MNKNPKNEFSTKFLQWLGVEEAGLFVADADDVPANVQAAAAAEVDHRDLHRLGEPLSGQASRLQPDQGPPDGVVRRFGSVRRYRGSDGN